MRPCSLAVEPHTTRHGGGPEEEGGRRRRPRQRCTDSRGQEDGRGLGVRVGDVVRVPLHERREHGGGG